jgi:hypothetical protein
MSLKANTAVPAASPERSHSCWESGKNVPCLRVEFVSGETFLFPYIHLVSARYYTENAEETLQITFVSHEMIIKGHDLRQISLALQNFLVQAVIELAPRYQNLREASGPLITSIRVTAVK